LKFRKLIQVPSGDHAKKITGKAGRGDGGKGRNENRSGFSINMEMAGKPPRTAIISGIV